MKLPAPLEAYLNGWLNFVGSMLYVCLWSLILSLPVLPFALFLRNQLVLVIAVLWIPFISHKTGMLVFETDIDRGKRRARKESEVELIRKIIATRAEPPEPGDEGQDAT